MATWRKGLWWDKKLGRWVYAKPHRPISLRILNRRKPKPKPRKAKPPKPSKVPKKPTKPKRPPGWRKGLKFVKGETKETSGWYEVANDRMLTERAIRFRVGYMEQQERIRTEGEDRELMFQLIKDTLREAVRRLKDEYGYAADMGKPHRNKDGSIDAVLRVKPKRGQSVNEAYMDMEDTLAPIPGAFVSSAVRYHPREDERFYTKFMGMSQAQGYYQEMSPERLHVNFMTGKVIDSEMRKRGRKKAEQVVMLINWNPEHERPVIPWQRELQKARKKKGK